VGISPSASGGASLPPRLDTSSAHSARVWNYLLDGKDNFAADREVGDMILQMFPGIAHIARLQRLVEPADAEHQRRRVPAGR
jgi:S-adenosyl methyltransferase